MRITLLTGAFPLRSQAFIVNKATALCRAGHQVSVFASGRGDDDDRDVVESSAVVRYHSASAAVRACLHRPASAARLAAAIAARRDGPRASAARLARSLPVLELDGDILHVEWATKAAERSEVLSLVRVPTVVSCRGTDVLLMAKADLGLAKELRRVFAAVDAVHCVSHAVAAAAMELGAQSEKVFVVHPAVDPSRFDAERPARSDGVLRVVSVGRLHPVKGYGDALRALDLLTARGVDVSYSILGGGSPEDVAEFERQRNSLGLGERVELMGARPATDVPAHLAAADVFLLPSLSEGMSNAAIEAMAAGLPVVVTDVGGMTELVRDGVDGLVVPPRDAEAMAAAISKLASDPDLRLSLGDKARERVRADFSLDGQAARLAEQYQKVIAQHREQPQPS